MVVGFRVSGVWGNGCGRKRFTFRVQRFRLEDLGGLRGVELKILVVGKILKRSLGMYGQYSGISCSQTPPHVTYSLNS